MFKAFLDKLHIGESHHQRQNWGSNLEYYLSSIGFSVGFGSLWRFPYVVYANGGGVFLIPYVFFFFVLALPMFYLESALGQVYQQAAPGCLEKAGKRFRGVGVGQVITSFFLGSFYNILMAYSLLFLWDSFSWELPWKVEQDASNPSDKLWDPDYFYKQILNITSGPSELGGFNYPVMFASIVSFIIVYLCVAQGVKTSGKVVYVSAPLPYILLFILLIRGMYLEGAWEGIAYMFEIDWAKLWEIEVWYRAANQVLFQYSVAVATLHALASYKEKQESIIRPCITIPVITAFTGILCGLTVFAYMGHMASVAGVSIHDLPLSGPDLVFVAYPAALTLMPGSTFWAILFFVMLYFLGIDTEFCFLETVGGFLEDEKIKIFGKVLKIEVLRAGMTVVFFILGVFLYTNAGFHYLPLYDDYITIVPMLLTATAECLIFGWLVGFDKLKRLVGINVREEVPPVFILCIKWVALPVLAFMLFGSFKEVIFENLFNYPWWGMLLALFFTGLPIFAVVYYYKKYENVKDEEEEVEVGALERPLVELDEFPNSRRLEY